MRVLAAVTDIVMGDTIVPAEPGQFVKIDVPPEFAKVGQEMDVEIRVRVHAVLSV